MKRHGTTTQRYRHTQREIRHTESDRQRADDRVQKRWVQYYTEGCMLGHWEAELKTPMIEFSALGPKSYAYKCVDSEEDSVKCKGVTLNFANSQKFNFDTLKGLVHGETNTFPSVFVFQILLAFSPTVMTRCHNNPNIV